MLLKFKDFINESKKLLDDFSFKCLLLKDRFTQHSRVFGTQYGTLDYWKVFVRPNDFDDINIDDFKNIPILSYDKKVAEHLIKNGIPEKNIYNKPKYKEEISNKSEFYKIHKDSEYISKTVYSIKDINKLSFPIIAKPNDGHSGMGIKIFNKPNEIKDPDKFDLFQEKINIKNEYRVFCFKGKPLLTFERIPIDDKTKDMSKKNVDDKINLQYKEIPYIKDFDKVVDYFYEKHKGIDFYALDLATDVNNKTYCIEINTSPGVPNGVLALVYGEIYKDFYKKSLPKHIINKLNDVRLSDKETLHKLKPNKFI